ncbi:hypothetical protein [Leptolyngbya sp. FACHB-17]|nr:hypothetical protein [Leptolyngbya sp. FACHB-17]
MHELQPILEGALGYEMALPARKLRNLEAFVEIPEVDRVIIDAKG